MPVALLIVPRMEWRGFGGILGGVEDYRRKAQNEPEIYLPNVAVTLRKLGILDRTELV
jgi:hypothetical protein